MTEQHPMTGGTERTLRQAVSSTPSRIWATRWRTFGLIMARSNPILERHAESLRIEIGWCDAAITQGLAAGIGDVDGLRQHRATMAAELDGILARTWTGGRAGG